jgi:hypothetical protein
MDRICRPPSLTVECGSDFWFMNTFSNETNPSLLSASPESCIYERIEFGIGASKLFARAKSAGEKKSHGRKPERSGKTRRHLARGPLVGLWMTDAGT